MESVLWFSEQLAVNSRRVALWGGGPRCPCLGERFQEVPQLPPLWGQGSTEPSCSSVSMEGQCCGLSPAGWQCSGEPGGMVLSWGASPALAVPEKHVGFTRPGLPHCELPLCQGWAQWRGDGQMKRWHTQWQTEWRSSGCTAAAARRYQSHGHISCAGHPVTKVSSSLSSLFSNLRCCLVAVDW